MYVYVIVCAFVCTCVHNPYITLLPHPRRCWTHVTVSLSPSHHALCTKVAAPVTFSHSCAMRVLFGVPTTVTVSVCLVRRCEYGGADRVAICVSCCPPINMHTDDNAQLPRCYDTKEFVVHSKRVVTSGAMPMTANIQPIVHLFW